MNGYLKSKFRRNIVIIVLTSIGMSVLRMFPAMVAGYSANEYIFSILMGYGKQGSNLLDFLYSVFYYVVPLYIIDIFLEQEMKNEYQIVKIRCQNLSAWKKNVKRICFTFSIQYIVIDFVVQGICMMVSHIVLVGNEGIFFDEMLVLYGVNMQDFVNAITVVLLARSIELLLLVMVNYLLVEKGVGTILAFFVSLLGYFVTAFFEIFKWEYLIPFGNAGLYHVLESVQLNGWKYMLIKLFGVYLAWCLCVIGLFRIKWEE